MRRFVTKVVGECHSAGCNERPLRIVALSKLGSEPSLYQQEVLQRAKTVDFILPPYCLFVRNSLCGLSATGLGLATDESTDFALYGYITKFERLDKALSTCTFDTIEHKRCFGEVAQNACWPVTAAVNVEIHDKSFQRNHACIKKPMRDYIKIRTDFVILCIVWYKK